jgi:hypothetical protein
MIYLPHLLEEFAASDDDTKADEYFVTMLRYQVEQQALEETSLDPMVAEMVASRNRWNASKEGFQFTKLTPCFKNIAWDSGVDFDDPLNCYAIAAAKTWYLQLDAFMECIVVDASSEENLFRNSNMEHPFWHNSWFLYMMLQSNANEWHDLTGVGIPPPGTTHDHEYCYPEELWRRFDVVLRQTFRNYVDAWVEWLRHYADKTSDIKMSLNRMKTNLMHNVRLTQGSKFRVGPEEEYDAPVTPDVLFEMAIRVKTPKILWQKIRDVITMRRVVFALTEAAAQSAEIQRIERCNNGQVDDWEV